MFGALGIMAAVHERERTGKGQHVQSGLFETNMVLVAQHMAGAAITGRDPPPFADPAMGKPWSVYDVFDTAEPGAQVFVGVVTETQWRGFCAAFGLEDLLADPALATQSQRVARAEALGLPFAPIAKPADLFDDPHLQASGGLLPTDLTGAEGAPGGVPAQATAALPALPVSMDGARLGLRLQPPRPGEHGAEVAREAGLSEAEIAGMIASGALSADVPAAAAE